MIFQINKLPFSLKLTTLAGKKPSNTTIKLLEVIKEISTHFKIENFKMIIGDSFFNCRHNKNESFWESEDEKPEGKTVPITVKIIERKYVINE